MIDELYANLFRATQDATQILTPIQSTAGFFQSGDKVPGAIAADWNQLSLNGTDHPADLCVIGSERIDQDQKLFDSLLEVDHVLPERVVGIEDQAACHCFAMSIRF